MSNITLKQGDCLDLMKELPDESIDAVITDPPYFVLKKQEWDMQWTSIEEYFNWFDKVFTEMQRILKKEGQMYIFFSQKFMFEYGTRYNPKRMLIWWHRNLSQPTNNMWLYQYDPIFYHIKGDRPKTFNGHFAGGYNSDILEYPKPQRWNNGADRFHPAEKNLDSLMRIIEISTKKNDIVLDPFMGSGTTGVASVQLNRNFIGYELSTDDYFKIAEKRIRKAQKQKKLGE